MDKPYKIVLRIDLGGKAIPYAPAVRPEGSVCHGFKMLKGAPSEQISAIPEIQDIPCLRDAVISINRPETAYFTVGCEKAFNKSEGGFWVRGYLEFSSNYTDIVADARNYFPLFFHFNHFVNEIGYADPVMFEWELQGATFLDANTKGFTVTVWIETADLRTEDEAKRVWCRAVEVVAEYLSNSDRHGQFPIYPPKAGAA